MQTKICFFGPIWGYLRSVQCVCTQKMPELFCSIFFWHTWYSNIKEQLWFWCFSAYFEVFGAWFLKKNSTSFVVKCQTKLNHAIYTSIATNKIVRIFWVLQGAIHFCIYNGISEKYYMHFFAGFLDFIALSHP